MTDGYAGYQHLIGTRVTGIQQCCQHIIRRARSVQKLGPGGVQNWAGDIITILRAAHAAVEAARARGSTALDQQVLDDLLERYDAAVKSGMIHTRSLVPAEQLPPLRRLGHRRARRHPRRHRGKALATTTTRRQLTPSSSTP